ncbi:snake venom vascular endothelial growth factor toxin ICPP-like isoform X1 [Carassius auratus]|uniref:Snake venom vascular endothelial growth factor toxin ICPP-like isoform X1 n=1 Tax=Carassius auratus TaxID=7957 RepID=A0A6P6IVP8_CARAU|nr:snake venom vascular endothelial growth factor toxin ICPP-like isoform X1 [Carassius auratus]
MRVFLCLLGLVLCHKTFGMNVQHPRNIGNESVTARNIYAESLCQPRKTLVEVEHEFPEAAVRRVIPSCVVLQRCGGCCSDEAMTCVSVSTHIKVMQLKQVTRNVRGDSAEMIELPFVEHSQCECRLRSEL